MARKNPALQSMWGTADASQIEAKNAEIEELKQQLEELQQTPSQAAGVQRYPIDQFIPLQLPDGLTQPRKYFDPTGMEKLKRSIEKVGIQEPLLVRPGKDDKLEIVSGERRWRTSLELGMGDLPAIAKALSDEDALEIALVANLMREDLNIIEETDSIIALIGLRLKVGRDQLPSLLIKIRNQRVRNEKNNQSIAEELQKADDYSGIITAESIFQIDSILSEFDITLDSFVSNRLSAVQKMPERLLDAVREGRLDFSKADVIRRAKLPLKSEEVLLQEVIDQGLTKSALMDRVKEAKAEEIKSEEPDQEDLRLQFHQRYQQLRTKRSWQKIVGNPVLKKKFEKMQSLADELVQAIHQEN